MIREEIQKFLQNIPTDIEREKILELPVSHIKGISIEVQKTLENAFKVRTISDFVTKILTHSNVQLLKVLGINANDLEKWQVIANYIFNIVKGKLDVTLSMKILLAGLDNAGKTAILNILQKRFNIANLKPTKDVDIEQLTLENVTFIIWDMGGQELYRKTYIAHPERFFVNVQSIIYVIDVQNKEDYEVTGQYLSKILDILETFNEFPDFLIFLHKADPQIYDKIKPNLVNLENLIKDIFENYEFQYRIFHTSIYNTVLTGDNIAESLRSLFEFTKRKEESPDIIDTMQIIYNNFINFSYLIENKFQQFESRLNSLETQIQQLNEGKKIEPSIKKPLPISEEKPVIPPREALNQELKRLFRRKQM